MAKIKAPTGPDGLAEALLDSDLAAKVFNKAAVADGTAKDFLTDYGKNFSKKNAETEDDLRTQVQSTLFDMLQGANNSGKYGPTMGAKLHDGKPVLTADGQVIVSKGRGAAYNQAAPGARLAAHEAKSAEGARLNNLADYFNAIYDLKTRSSRPGAQDRVAALTRIQEFQNSFSSEEPGAGGFLIPELQRAEILQLALEESVVRSRATVIPMSTLRVPIPTVDDTSHVTSLFGGVQFYWTEEAAALTESTATFGKVVLDAKKLTGFWKTPRELLQDAPAFAAWFDERVPKGFAWAEDVAFMTGDDAGQPLGFINCPASVQVAAETGQDTGTIVWENIVKAYARMLPQSLKNAVWVASINTFPQLATMALSVGTGGGPVWFGHYATPGSEAPPIMIMGRPVIFTEKVNALGTTGDINFVDLSYYLVGDRQEVRVDSSDQFLFQNDQLAYRMISRVDGRPWLQSALTPHYGGTDTLSPFVQVATR